MRGSVDTVTAVGVTGRMWRIKSFEESQDQMTSETSASFRFRICFRFTFVPDFDQRWNADVQQEIVQAETVASQQDGKQDGQVVVNGNILDIHLS